MLSGLLSHLAGLGVLLLLSAFFSASETALFSLSRMQVQRLGETGGRTGRAVARLLAVPHRLLITILVGNMVVNIALASIVAGTATALLGGRGVGAAIGVSTFFLLIFGEVTPKTFAVRNAEALSRAAALPLAALCRAITPVRFVLRGVTNGVLFLLRQGHVPSEELLTRREFKAALEVGEEYGAIDEHERDMVERIFEFRHMDARELMVPRTEMVCVGEDATIAEALEVARRTHHSRLPVHSGDIDEVWGELDVRDLPAWRGQEALRKTIGEFVQSHDPMAPPPRARPLVRAAFLVPETRNVGDLLRDMREGRAHMAVLLDEYGGTSGLVTLRHIVDELVGGVLTRGRAASPLYRKGEGTIQVLGEARLRDVNHELGLDLPLGRADTMGGYVLALFGSLPRPGDEVADGRFIYRVLRVAARRIDAVEVRPTDPASRAWRRLWREQAEREDAEAQEAGPC